MADKIIFPKKINTSVQVGDELWYSNVSTSTPSEPALLGTIIEKKDKWVKIDQLGTLGQQQSNVNLIDNGGFNTLYDASVITNGTFDTGLSGWTSYGNLFPSSIGTNFYQVGNAPTAGQNSLGEPLDTANPERMYLDNINVPMNTAPGGIEWNLSSTPLDVGSIYKLKFDYEIHQCSGCGTSQILEVLIQYHSITSILQISNPIGSHEIIFKLIVK